MKIINEACLYEMAMNRTDAIDRCISLGEKFIKHFKKIYDNPDSQDIHHWSSEMQAWFNSVNNIVLKGKQKKPLSITQKVDWFFSFGSSYEDYFNNDTTMIELYEELINDLTINNLTVYDSIVKMF